MPNERNERLDAIHYDPAWLDRAWQLYDPSPFVNGPVEEPDEPDEQLTEDESRMLAAYRRFKTRNLDGIFSWRFSDFDRRNEDQHIFLVPDTPSLLHDPRDVSNA